MIDRQSAAGDDAMQMRILVQVLSPGMQDGEETEFGSQMPAIAGKGEQGLSGDAKKQIAELLLVVEHQFGDGFWNSEDHVKILDWQQFALPAFQPLGARQGLAFGTMPVAAGVVADASVLAVAALFDVSA